MSRGERSPARRAGRQANDQTSGGHSVPTGTQAPCAEHRRRGGERSGTAAPSSGAVSLEACQRQVPASNSARAGAPRLLDLPRQLCMIVVRSTATRRSPARRLRQRRLAWRDASGTPAATPTVCRTRTRLWCFPSRRPPQDTACAMLSGGRRHVGGRPGIPVRSAAPTAHDHAAEEELETPPRPATVMQAETAGMVPRPVRSTAARRRQTVLALSDATLG